MIVIETASAANAIGTTAVKARPMNMPATSPRAQPVRQ
jgi:hypothetical protein